MSYDVISIGEPAIDFFPQDEKEGLVYRALPGGGAVNVLAEVCAMGGSALLLGAVGKDLFGDFLMEQVARAGVGTQAIRRTDAKNTGIGFVQLSPDGERSFLHYRDYHAKTKLWSEAGENAITNCQIFHFTSVSLVDTAQREDTWRAIRLAKDCKKLVSFDVNYRESMWEDRLFARELFSECIEIADIVKVSEEERNFLCSTSDNDAAARVLSSGMEKLILISLGTEGSFVSCQSGSGICRSFPVKAKDTTGCGDAFVGAVLAGLIPWVKKGQIKSIPFPQMKRIVETANAAGAICATRFGSLSSMPSCQDVLDFMEKVM